MATTMPVSRRTPPNGKGATVVNSQIEEPEAIPSNPRELLSNKEVPLWYSQTFIYSSYRPVTHSVKFCFRSLLYIHNETVNIYSHLIPAILALASVPLISWYFRTNFPEATRTDRLIFEIYLSTSVICFTISSLYHTLLCHSKHYFDLWVRIDYVAILFQILGSFISGIYLGFYCERRLQILYWSMIGILAALTAFVVVNPRLQSPRWRLLRTGSFVATGLSAFVPIIHAVTLFPYWQLDKQAGLRYYYIEGALVLVGAYHFTTHFPESWKPGKFDILGASHQIFHLLVALAAVVHVVGITSAFRWNYENAICLKLQAPSV